MEVLKVLEDKIIALVDTITTLKADNRRLTEKNEELNAELELMQKSILEGSEKASALSKEKTDTVTLVDDLIKSIDSLVQEAQ